MIPQKMLGQSQILFCFVFLFHVLFLYFIIIEFLNFLFYAIFLNKYLFY